MKSRVKDVDKGWKRIKRDMRAAKRRAAKIGVQSSEGMRDDGISMLTVAAANEFGTSDGHIPERSYIRASFDENSAKYFRGMKRLAQEIFAGQKTVDGALAIMGMQAQADIQKYMTDLQTPPNAPATIAAKGSDNPLIDTGALRASIRYIVEDR